MRKIFLNTARYLFEMALVTGAAWFLIVATQSFEWLLPQILITAARTWAFLERTK